MLVPCERVFAREYNKPIESYDDLKNEIKAISKKGKSATNKEVSLFCDKAVSFREYDLVKKHTELHKAIVNTKFQSRQLEKELKDFIENGPSKPMLYAQGVAELVFTSCKFASEIYFLAESKGAKAFEQLIIKGSKLVDAKDGIDLAVFTYELDGKKDNYEKMMTISWKAGELVAEGTLSVLMSMIDIFETLKNSLDNQADRLDTIELLTHLENDLETRISKFKEDSNQAYNELDNLIITKNTIDLLCNNYDKGEEKVADETNAEDRQKTQSILKEKVTPVITRSGSSEENPRVVEKEIEKKNQKNAESKGVNRKSIKKNNLGDKTHYLCMKQHFFDELIVKEEIACVSDIKECEKAGGTIIDHKYSSKVNCKSECHKGTSFYTAACNTDVMEHIYGEVECVEKFSTTQANPLTAEDACRKGFQEVCDPSKYKINPRVKQYGDEKLFYLSVAATTEAVGAVLGSDDFGLQKNIETQKSKTNAYNPPTSREEVKTDSLSNPLVGTWLSKKHRTKWILAPDGTGQFIQESINQVAAKAVTKLKWKADYKKKKFTYTLLKYDAATAGQSYSARDNKTYTIPFTLIDNRFKIGGATYSKI